MVESDRGIYRRKPGVGSVIGSVIGWAILVLVLAAITYIGYLTWYYYDKIRRGEYLDLPQYASQMTEAPPGEKAPFAAPYADRKVVEDTNSPAFGSAPESAKLVVVEFGDYHCPYSKEVTSVFREMMAKYGDRARFIYRDFPTSSSAADPIEAALAAHCAGEQGKFWPYHDKLYAFQDRLTTPDLSVYASQVNIDLGRFEKCLQERRFESAIASDIQAARASGVIGTPTFFFNGIKVEGALPREAFETIINKLLQ